MCQQARDEANSRVEALLGSRRQDRTTSLVAALMFEAYSLEDFKIVLDSVQPYPFYAVLLYPPLNGLNEKLHDYVLSHWALLNSMTGNNCLLLAIESQRKPIQKFKPGDVYAIARLLGAEVDQVPCLVFFTDKEQRRTLVQPLGQVLTPTTDVTNDMLTEFFQGVQAIIDRCARNGKADARYDCLQRRFTRQYVLPRQGRKAVTMAIQVVDTISQLVSPITEILRSVK